MPRLQAVLLVLALVVWLPISAAAQIATPEAVSSDLRGARPLPMTSERQSELERYVAEMLEKTQVPGAAIAVVQDGEVVYLQGFGVRELGSPEPVTPDTLMMIGSVTKSMTATMAGTLVDEGTLSWDTTVASLLPEFAVADPDLTSTLTVRNAFCACTGLPQRDGDFIFNSDSYPPERLIASVADFPLTAPLGESFQYSNQMFAIGGYAAAAAASGGDENLYDTYVAAMQQRLLDPLGMPHSTFDLDDVLASGNYAVPHGQTLTGAFQELAVEDDVSFAQAVAPAGALWSSAAEMALYLQLELDGGLAPDGTRVITTTNLQATWEPQVSIPADILGPGEFATMAHGYGLGWVIGDYHGQPLIWHSGGTFGFSSQMAFLPDADLGIVVLTNGAAADVLTLAIQYHLLAELFGQPQSVDALVEQQLGIVAQEIDALQASLGEVDEKAVGPYLGSYHHDVLDDVEIVWDDGELVFDLGEFRSTLVSMRDDAGNASAYVLADSPLAGGQVTFAIADGAPSMTLADPQSGEAYTFAFVEEESAAATPVAAERLVPKWMDILM